MGTALLAAPLLLAAPSPARAAEAVTVKPVPPKVELSAVSTTKATVVVSNEGVSAVTEFHLTAAGDGAWPAEATVWPKSLQSLGPGQARTYTLVLPPWQMANLPSPLSLIGSFEGVGGVAKVSAASIELLPPGAPDLDKIATAEVKASLATMRSNQTEQVYLLIHNKSAQTLQVGEPEPNGPDFIEFSEIPKSTTVAPGRTSVLTLDATADSRVEPGEHQLVFKLPCSIDDFGFDLVATQTAKVGVEGETELLTVLGVPSLLLLPGFLFLATASIFWRFRFLRKDWDGDAFPLPLKEPEFWVMAVLVSIVAVLLARFLGDIDLFGRYGLQDLIRIWLESMLAGFAAYVTYVLLRNRARSKRVPSDQDDACTVLDKLASQGLNIERPRISYDLGAGAGAIQLYLLQPMSENRPSTWACPRIVFTWTGDVDTALNDSIQTQLDHTHDPKALARDLRKGKKNGSLAVGFEGGRSPMMVDKGKIGPTAKDVMVCQE